MGHEFINSITLSSLISTAAMHPAAKKRTKMKTREDFDIDMTNARRISFDLNVKILQLSYFIMWCVQTQKG